MTWSLKKWLEEKREITLFVGTSHVLRNRNRSTVHVHTEEAVEQDRPAWRLLLLISVIYYSSFYSSLQILPSSTASSRSMALSLLLLFLLFQSSSSSSSSLSGPSSPLFLHSLQSQCPLSISPTPPHQVHLPLIHYITFFISQITRLLSKGNNLKLGELGIVASFLGNVDTIGIVWKTLSFLM